MLRSSPSVCPQGFRVVPAEECWRRSLQPLMEEVREQMGDKPVYISFDIDGLDPAYAPGTGTPEIAGLTPAQVKGCSFASRWEGDSFPPVRGGQAASATKQGVRDAGEHFVVVVVEWKC